jgi:hypothetical protein
MFLWKGAKKRCTGSRHWQGWKKIIDPISTELYRRRETERGERRKRRCKYGGRVYEKYRSERTQKHFEMRETEFCYITYKEYIYMLLTFCCKFI